MQVMSGSNEHLLRSRPAEGSWLSQHVSNMVSWTAPALSDMCRSNRQAMSDLYALFHATMVLWPNKG